MELNFDVNFYEVNQRAHIKLESYCNGYKLARIDENVFFQNPQVYEEYS